MNNELKNIKLGIDFYTAIKFAIPYEKQLLDYNIKQELKEEFDSLLIYEQEDENYTDDEKKQLEKRKNNKKEKEMQSALRKQAKEDRTYVLWEITPKNEAQIKGKKLVPKNQINVFENLQANLPKTIKKKYDKVLSSDGGTIWIAFGDERNNYGIRFFVTSHKDEQGQNIINGEIVTDGEESHVTLPLPQALQQWDNNFSKFKNLFSKNKKLRRKK